MLGSYLPIATQCFLVFFCCITMVLMSLKVCQIVFYGILSFFSKIFIEEMCVVALVYAVMTINGSTFHPVLVMLSMSG